MIGEVIFQWGPWAALRGAEIFGRPHALSSRILLVTRERGEDFAIVDVRDAPDRPGREFVFIARAV